MENRQIVSIIVVNWNGKHLLYQCLKSLSEQTYPSREVILVDNGSTDGSVEYVRQTFPWARVISSAVNVGYAGGCNLGARQAHGEYVMLVNNDTRFAPELTERLVEAIESDPRFGAVSAVPVDNLDVEPSAAQRAVTINVVGKHLHHTTSSVSPFYAPGACCLYRRDAVPEPYDSDYFCYDEDVYLSWLLRLRGFDIGIVPQARFEHNTSSTSRRIWEYVVFCAERNRWTNLLLFYEIPTLAKLTPLIILNILVKILAGIQDLRPKLRAHLWLVRNLKLIFRKRAKIQAYRRVRDADIIWHMTGKVTPGSSVVTGVGSLLTLLYLRAVGIRTHDTPARLTRRVETPRSR